MRRGESRSGFQDEDALPGAREEQRDVGAGETGADDDGVVTGLVPRQASPRSSARPGGGSDQAPGAPATPAGVVCANRQIQAFR